MNKKVLPVLLMAILSSATFFSCKKNHNDNNSGDQTMNYYPLQLGKFVTYTVDSTFYNGGNCKVTDHISQIRYSVSDTFRDDQKRLSYLVNVDYRPGIDTAAWKQQGVIYVTNTGSTLEYVQSSLRFIKLVFPVTQGTKWSGNQYIATADTPNSYYAGWAYAYENVAQPYNNGFVNFDNTVTVSESDDAINNTGASADSIAYKYRSYAKEVYAYNIGMVYREVTHLTYDSTMNRCTDGISVTYKAVDHN